MFYYNNVLVIVIAGVQLAPELNVHTFIKSNRNCVNTNMYNHNGLSVPVLAGHPKLCD